ncbi:helix-turn-helix transcriptional regulator [Pseudomonas putida]|nr:helix-turn-helix transcriptional regulator [Pseudomonas putida]
MSDKEPMGTVELMGSALVIQPLFETILYKVELSRIAARSDKLQLERFADGAWSTVEIYYEEEPALLQWVEEEAKRLAPEDYQWWEERLAFAPRPTQPQRISRLVRQIMSKFDMTQASVADRVGVTRQTLSNYCEGRGKGSGVTLELALEALLARPVFGVAEDSQE